METQKLKANSCPDHPSQPKEFLCLTCKKIYCLTCYQLDRAHKTDIRPISDQLLYSYELQKYLGAGSFGSVFKVVGLADGLPYAIKAISQVNSEEDFDRFSHETKLHAKMSHPNIIKYYNSFRIQSENLLVVVLEVADHSLASELKSLSQSTAFEYLAQIIEALRYLHDDLKIAHRDLKPKNILLKQGKIKLCDMGEAKVLDKKNLTLSNKKGFGTIRYLSPEVLNGKKYNEKSDIWAVGIVFHMMLSNGKHPFDEKNTKNNDEIVKNISRNNIKLDECIQHPKYLEILESKILFSG